MQRMNRNAIDSQPQSMKILVMFSQPLFSMKDFLASYVIMNHLRKSMDPDSLELLLFLKVNYEYYWKDAKIIDEIITENHIRDEDDNDN